LPRDEAAVRISAVSSKRTGTVCGKGAVFLVEVRNLLDRTYIVSADNIIDSINAATGLQNTGSVLVNTGTGSIYAGAPRTFVAGMKLVFR
jgi:hypothetical protein